MIKERYRKLLGIVGIVEMEGRYWFCVSVSLFEYCISVVSKIFISSVVFFFDLLLFFFRMELEVYKINFN